MKIGGNDVTRAYVGGAEVVRIYMGAALVFDGTIVPPALISDPTIAGTAQVGQTLTGADGTWTGSPTFARQWLRAGVAISGATSSTYLVQSADAGMLLTFRVSSTNAGGSAVATSASVGPVTAVPAVTTPATITGTTADTGLLTVTVGAASGAPTPTSAIQWRKDGANIVATGTTVDKATFGTGVYSAVVTWTNGISPNATSTSNNITVAVLGGGPVALNDTFSGEADGTNLTAHTADTGETWAIHPAAASSDLRMTADGFVYIGAAGTNLYSASKVTASADAVISVDITAKTIPPANPSGAKAVGVMGRLNPTAATFYMARVNYIAAGSFQLQLFRSVSGTIAQIGSTSFTTTWAQGETKKISLSMVGSEISLLLDGSAVFSVADTQITAAGLYGLRTFSVSAYTAMTGLQYTAIHEGLNSPVVEPPPSEITFTPAALDEDAAIGSTAGSFA